MLRELRQRLARVVIVTDDAQTLELVEKCDRISDGLSAPWVGEDDRVISIWNERVEFGFTLVRLETVVSGLVYTDHYWVPKRNRKREVCVRTMVRVGRGRTIAPLPLANRMLSADTRQKYIQRTSASAAASLNMVNLIQVR